MNFTALISKLKEKKVLNNETIHSIPGLKITTSVGLRKALERKTLTITDLEAISSWLQIPLTYWWLPSEKIKGFEKIANIPDEAMDVLAFLNNEIIGLKSQINKCEMQLNRSFKGEINQLPNNS